MQAFLKIEAPEKTYEFLIRQVGVKQVISMELADLLNILGGKPVKESKGSGSLTIASTCATKMAP